MTKSISSGSVGSVILVGSFLQRTTTRNNGNVCFISTENLLLRNLKQLNGKLSHVKSFVYTLVLELMESVSKSWYWFGSDWSVNRE